MILRCEGNVNKFYLQTLCLIYFPGAKFEDGEEETPETPIVTVKLTEDSEGATATVSIRIGDRECSAEASRTKLEGSYVVSIGKIAIGRAFLAAGKEFFKYSPPWGMLTGVRPAKIATEYLIAGNGVQKTKRVLRDEYFLNPKKAALATSVAVNEDKIIKIAADPRLCSVYISIPFCPSRCAYCSFVSYTSSKLMSLIDDYLEELYLDIDNMFDIIKSLDMRVATIYIGGGTPTTLTAYQLDTLLSRIAENIDTSTLMEFTLEAGRPDTIDAEKLKVAKSWGVTRISVNPQTLNDELLASIGRRHTVDDFYRAYEIAQNSGIRDINVDLIAGLPGDNFANFSQTLDKIIELDPTNITVHTFCVKKAADILRSNSNIYSLSSGDTGKCVQYSQLKTKLAQYKPYYMYRQKNTVGNLENVGYSKEGHEGLYNVFMMEEVQSIFSVGAGAVTKLVEYHSLADGGRTMQRIFTPKYPYEYLRDAKKIRTGDPDTNVLPIRERIINFYRKD